MRLPDQAVLLAAFEDIGNTVRRRTTGREAAALNNHGYLVTSVGSKTYLVHRVLYKMRHGYCPALLDHADRNPLNNTEGNLREADKRRNGANTKRSRLNTSGTKGVTWQRGKWVVQLVVAGQHIYGGRFAELADAVAHSQTLRQQYHGDFAGEV